MIRFHVLSIFPETVENYCSESILKRAKEKNLVDFKFYNIRDYTLDKHGKVDDKPYSGGPGMVMTAQPILDCVAKIKAKVKNPKKVVTVIFVPEATKWTNKDAKSYSKKYSDVILICGRYEGIDYRVNKILKAKEVSVGDYVLTGGEIPAMILIDSISRQIKGVLGKFESVEENRESTKEFYTRPEILKFKGKTYKVPPVFLSGNPKLISEYRAKSKKSIRGIIAK